jgi:hypothetical protein
MLRNAIMLRKLLDKIGTRSGIFGNKNSTIVGNTLIFNSKITYADGGSPIVLADDIPVGVPLSDFVETAASNREQRTMINLEIMQRIFYKYKNEIRKPNIRCYGLYSSLSLSERHISGFSDYATMIREEHHWFKQFVVNGFPCYYCLSLDPRVIVETGGYSKAEMEFRFRSLLENISDLTKKFPNLFISIDDYNRMNSMIAIGADLIIEAPQMKPNQSYTTTVYHSDPVTCKNKIQAFDEIFQRAALADAAIRRKLWIEKFNDYLTSVYRHRTQSEE